MKLENSKGQLKSGIEFRKSMDVKMTSLKDQILATVSRKPGLTDREITYRIRGTSAIQQPINQACRALENGGLISRKCNRPNDNLIGNYLVKNPQFFKKTPLLPDSSVVRRTTPKRYVVKEVIDVAEFKFQKICLILPNRCQTGQVEKFLPQSRYENTSEKDLHKFGNGPFCKFKIPNDIKSSGVYALMVDGELKYLGECENLAKRYNTMYGNIPPAACYKGGRETDCRINNHIYRASVENREVSLWFLNTPRFKEIEVQLRQKLRPIWNLI